jgi:metal-responsive CopG/Arc/MetJ family transcriptional regulator
VRTHVNLPAELVREVDDLVGDRGRSQFVAAAIAKELARVKLLRAAEAAMGARATVDVPGWETAEAASRWVHDLRRADLARQEHLGQLRVEPSAP